MARSELEIIVTLSTVCEILVTARVLRIRIITIATLKSPKVQISNLDLNLVTTLLNPRRTA
jgi:hypothetical protein